MCERGPHFKFCTCDPKDLGKNFWKLTRGPKYSRSNIMGKFITPANEHPFDKQQFCIDRMLFDLNNEPIFDFEYTPQENDLLEITLNFGDEPKLPERKQISKRVKTMMSRDSVLVNKSIKPFYQDKNIHHKLVYKSKTFKSTFWYDEDRVRSKDGSSEKKIEPTHLGIGEVRYVSK